MSIELSTRNKGYDCSLNKPQGKLQSFYRQIRIKTYIQTFPELVLKHIECHVCNMPKFVCNVADAPRTHSPPGHCCMGISICAETSITPISIAHIHTIISPNAISLVYKPPGSLGGLYGGRKVKSGLHSIRLY